MSTYYQKHKQQVEDAFIEAMKEDFKTMPLEELLEHETNLSAHPSILLHESLLRRITLSLKEEIDKRLT